MKSYLKFKMISNVILNAVIIIQLFVVTTDAYKYVCMFRDDPLFSPCEMANVHSLDEFVDMSAFNFEYLSNESYDIHGSMVLFKDIGTGNNPFNVEMFKKIRGTWVSTIYSMKSNDWCKTTLDPSAFWAKYIKKISPENRKCPFSKGTKLDFDNAEELTFNSTDSKLSGEYKMQILIELKELKVTDCANMFAEIYRD